MCIVFYSILMGKPGRQQEALGAVLPYAPFWLVYTMFPLSIDLLINIKKEAPNC